MAAELGIRSLRSPILQPDRKTAEVHNLAYRSLQASQVIALLVATLGVVVLCGWAFNVPALTYIRPTLQSMKVNTALSFLLLGTGLWLAQDDKRQRTRRILGLVVVVIAGATLVEYNFHVSLGIDQSLFRDTRTPSLSAYPGRMAIATAICFLLLGSAVAFLGTKKAIALQRALVVACFAFSLVALCGYLYGVQSLYSITSFSTIGLHTSAGLFAVCLAYFLARPDEGIVSIAVSDSYSGFLLRTLFPAIVVVPILIGWLLAGQRANLYGTPFGLALMVLGTIGCLAALTVMTVRSMHRLEYERSRAEETVRESEQRFRLVADTAPALIWMSGTDKLRTYFNKPWLDFTGRSMEQELGNRWAEGVHPDDLQPCLDTYTQSFDRREKFRVEYRLRGSNGEYRWVLDIGVPRFNQDRFFAGYIGIAVDLTERKLAEESLRELNRTLEGQTALLQSREELLKIFVKHVPAAVAMLDRDMRYLQVSDRWCSDFSLDSSEMLGRSHYEIFPDIPERWKQIHRRALAGETLRAEEDRWDRAGGTTWLRWEIRPWQTLDGEPGGILIFSEDITHRKHTEEALAGLSGRLIEAQDEERKRIAREIHDDYSQRVALLGIDLEKLAENVEDPSGETSHKFHELFNLVGELGGDLHALSHRLHSSTLESLGLVVGLEALCKEFAEQQGIQVDFVHENVPRVVPADATLCMFRITQEALRNTKRHSSANRAEVRLEQQDGRLHLSVSDCGKGFDSNKPPADRGIGIHSMEERLRLLGGKLEIQSRPMEGTRIDAWLPLKMGSAA